MSNPARVHGIVKASCKINWDMRWYWKTTEQQFYWNQTNWPMEIRVMSSVVEVSYVQIVKVKHLGICSMQNCNRECSCGSQGGRRVMTSSFPNTVLYQMACIPFPQDTWHPKVSEFSRLRKVDYPRTCCTAAAK